MLRKHYDITHPIFVSISKDTNNHIFLKLSNLDWSSLSIPLSPFPAASGWATLLAASGLATAVEGALTSCGGT